MKRLLPFLVVASLAPATASAISTGAVRAVELNQSTEGQSIQQVRRAGLDDQAATLQEEINGYSSEIYATRARKDAAVQASIHDVEAALEIVGAPEALDRADKGQVQATIAGALLDMEQRLAQLEQYRTETKAEYEDVLVARDRLNIPLNKLEAMPGIAAHGENGKVAPKLSVTSWDGADFGANNMWHYGYGVNVDIQAGKVSSAPDKAADEFLLSGGDGNIDLSVAVGRKLGSSADVSVWLGGSQSWLDTTLEENGEAVQIDDDIRRYRAGILLQTRYFYMAGEWIKNEYSGTATSEFAQMVDGESGIKLSFITRLDKDFYLRYDSMEGKTGNQSTVTLTKNLTLF